MASNITLSAGVRANLLNLQQTAALKDLVQGRLSTGKKVNSALDNPTNFFTAAALTARSNDLKSLLDGISNGIQTLKAADNGISSITTSIESLQATVRQARQDKSYKNASYALDPAGIGTAAVKSLSIAGGGVGTTPVKIALNASTSVTGTTAFAAPASAGNLTIRADDMNGGANVSVSITPADTLDTTIAKINAAAGGGVVASKDAGGTRLVLTDAAGNNLTVTAGAAIQAATGLSSGTIVPTVNSAVKSVDEIVDAINSNVKLKGQVRASNDSGKLRIENDYTKDLTVAGFNAGSGQWDGSAGVRTVGGNEVRQNLVAQFNEVRDQLNKFADDASINGVNLLRGDTLKLNFNESSTSSLTIQSKDPKGVSTDTLGITSATVDEFGSDDALDTRLNQLTDALTKLRSQAAAFGSKLSIVQNREDFTKALTNTLQVGADKLTLADTNEEGANLLALNTRQQLQTTSLSFASQADQAVLQFLR